MAMHERALDAHKPRAPDAKAWPVQATDEAHRAGEHQRLDEHIGRGVELDHDLGASGLLIRTGFERSIECRSPCSGVPEGIQNSPEGGIRAGRCTVSGPSWSIDRTAAGQSQGRPRDLPYPMALPFASIVVVSHRLLVQERSRAVREVAAEGTLLCLRATADR
jgi:hypothetical protein